MYRRYRRQCGSPERVGTRLTSPFRSSAVTKEAICDTGRSAFLRFSASLAGSIPCSATMFFRCSTSRPANAATSPSQPGLREHVVRDQHYLRTPERSEGQPHRLIAESATKHSAMPHWLALPPRPPQQAPQIGNVHRFIGDATSMILFVNASTRHIRLGTPSGAARGRVQPKSEVNLRPPHIAAGRWMDGGRLGQNGHGTRDSPAPATPAQWRDGGRDRFVGGGAQFYPNP